MQDREDRDARPPIGILFEGDLERRIDTVLAIAMLNGLARKSEARSVSLSISRPSLTTARYADVVARFYGGRAPTIGMPEGTSPDPDAPALAATLSRQAADGTQPYTSEIESLLDTADNAVLIRNMLLAQHDANAAIVLAGPATGLVRLLGLYGAPPQVAAKVRHLVVAAGSFSGGPPEPGVAADVDAARRLFAEWPTPVIAVGSEIGDALPYPASSIEQDFAWSPAHPVVDAYRASSPVPYDAPAAALAAVLHAVHPDGGYFALSEPGTIDVQDDGRTVFTPGAGGPHRHLLVDPAQRDRITSLYTELVSTPPAPPRRRGNRGNAAAAAAQAPQAPPPQAAEPEAPAP